MRQNTTEEDIIVQTIATGVHDWITKEFNRNIDKINDIKIVVRNFLMEAKETIKEHKRELEDNYWNAKVMFDAGYKRQCLVLEPFKAKTKEEAQKMAERHIATLFEENPNVEIYEIKVKKFV